MVNLRELPDEELEHMIDTTDAYLRKLEKEQQRRETIKTAEENMNDLNVRYFQAMGIKDGQPWSGPSSAAEAYPEGWTATHMGGLWKSCQPGNIDEPGETDAWERVGDDPLQPRTPSESVLPGVGVLLFGGDDSDTSGDVSEDDAVEDEGLPGEDDA